MRIITAAVLIAENYLLQLFCENVCYWLSIRIKYLQKILVLIKRLTKSITTSQNRLRQIKSSRDELQEMMGCTVLARIFRVSPSIQNRWMVVRASRPPLNHRPNTHYLVTVSSNSNNTDDENNEENSSENR